MDSLKLLQLFLNDIENQSSDSSHVFIWCNSLVAAPQSGPIIAIVIVAIIIIVIIVVGVIARNKGMLCFAGEYNFLKLF